MTAAYHQNADSRVLYYRLCEWFACRRKTGYPSRAHALGQAVNRVTAQNANTQDLSVYHCGQCGQWHLSKQVQRGGA